MESIERQALYEATHLVVPDVEPLLLEDLGQGGVAVEGGGGELGRRGRQGDRARQEEGGELFGIRMQENVIRN